MVRARTVGSLGAWIILLGTPLLCFGQVNVTPQSSPFGIPPTGTVHARQPVVPSLPPSGSFGNTLSPAGVEAPGSDQNMIPVSPEMSTVPLQPLPGSSSPPILHDPAMPLADCSCDSPKETNESFMEKLQKLVSKEESYPKVRLTGFFQADAVIVGQDTGNRLAVGDVQNGADFRRARLAAAGEVWKNVGYMVEFDFAFPGRPSFMDVYLDIHDLPLLGHLRVGQWRQPFSMDAMTSVRELTFLERALPFAFVPFRQIGIGAYDTAFEERMTWAVSAFRYPTDVFGGNVGDNGGVGVTTRETFLPIYEENQYLVHVGGNFSFIDPSNDATRFLSTPEVFVGETPGSLAPLGVPANFPPFVDTGLMPTTNVQLYGVEAAAQYGSFYMQSELIYAHVNRIANGAVTFPGLYIYGSYLLTGEVRPYNKKAGAFGRVDPKHPCSAEHGGCGAWEVAARCSYLDLNDTDVQGGRLTDLTLGVNWYLNKYTKFQFNYIHAMLNDKSQGNTDADILAWRGQLDF